MYNFDDFKYKNPPTDLHRELIEAMKEYIEHNEKWMEKSYGARIPRARNALLKLHKLSKARRAELIEERDLAKNETV